MICFLRLHLLGTTWVINKLLPLPKEPCCPFWTKISDHEQVCTCNVLNVSANSIWFMLEPGLLLFCFLHANLLFWWFSTLLWFSTLYGYVVVVRQFPLNPLPQKWIYLLFKYCLLHYFRHSRWSRCKTHEGKFGCWDPLSYFVCLSLYFSFISIYVVLIIVYGKAHMCSLLSVRAVMPFKWC